MVPQAMPWTLLAQLIVFTAGSVLYLFLLVLLAGLRRPRLFESLLFLTGICLFFVYAGSLLELNLQLYYDVPPFGTEAFASALLAIGLMFFPALLIHAHGEFYRKLHEGRRPRGFVALLCFAYLTCPVMIALGVMRVSGVRGIPNFVFEYSLAIFPVMVLLSAAFQWSFALFAPNAGQGRLHRTLSVLLALNGLLLLVWVLEVSRDIDLFGEWSLIAFCSSLLLPGAVLGYFFIRQRFLPAGVQRHLVFSVSAAFLALLYLTVALRLSEWLKDYLPPVATLSILLFVLVIFFEPLQRRVGELLQHTFRREAEKLQRLTAEVQQVARTGELDEVVRFAETRIAEALALPHVRIVLRDGPDRPAITSGPVQRFVLREGANEIGVLEAHYYGQTLSGETHAALEYLAEQLPAALDLCRLIRDKLRLERELAERQRLALLGQMAASVSHNLRNPLGSMKTLLQLQLESPELPPSAREDIRRVVAEIDQLSAKLTQLLQYSKPSVRSGASGQMHVNVTAHVRQAVALLRPEAERRRIALEEDPVDSDLFAYGTDEAVNEIMSNLLVNALEAVSEGGTVSIQVAARSPRIVLEVADDGPGIPTDLRERVF